MKLESKFGLGEVVVTKIPNTEKRCSHSDYGDDIFKVIGIVFSIDETTNYHCRCRDGRVVVFTECELEGDDSFNQEKGYYPNE